MLIFTVYFLAPSLPTWLSLQHVRHAAMLCCCVLFTVWHTGSRWVRCTLPRPRPGRQHTINSVMTCSLSCECRDEDQHGCVAYQRLRWDCVWECCSRKASVARWGSGWAVQGGGCADPCRACPCSQQTAAGVLVWCRQQLCNRPAWPVCLMVVILFLGSGPSLPLAAVCLTDRGCNINHNYNIAVRMCVVMQPDFWERLLPF